MELKLKHNRCDCGGDVVSYCEQASKVTIYTESGPLEAEHIDCRKGHYFGYSTDTPDRSSETCDEVAKSCYKFYDEDCLEGQVCLKKLRQCKNLFIQYLMTTRKTGFSVKFLYEMSLDFLYLNASFRYDNFIDYI